MESIQSAGKSYYPDLADAPARGGIPVSSVVVERSWKTLPRYGGSRSPKRIAAAAYAYACGDGPQPRELYLINCIDRFGVEAVLGRKVLGSKEIKLMAIAENISRWYDERKKAENPADWAKDNDNESSALTVAHSLAKKYGMLKE
jgi:hypothetical protein